MNIQRLLAAASPAFGALVSASLIASGPSRAGEPDRVPGSGLGGTVKAPDEKVTEGTSAGWSNDGQFWVIDLEPSALRMYAPETPPGVPSRGALADPSKKPGREASERVYWYFVYTLHNSSSTDRDVFVNVSAVSDGKRTYADSYLPHIEKGIERREKGPLWGKTDEFELLSKRDPKDPKYHYVTLPAKGTRNCVAVFSPIDPNASKITIRVTGLSNEILRLKKEDGAEELQDRVLEIRYVRPGDEYAVGLDTFKFVGKEWTKRKMPLSVPEGASKG
ncbi:MAG: hypothetical protein ACUVYA_15625 [Planctomycetota bacterium]